MKRTILIILVALLVLISSLLWIFMSRGNIGKGEVLQFGIIILLVLFALYIVYERIAGIKRGQPAEDELSKSLLQKAAASSYYISLYLWVFMIYLKDRVEMDTELMLGSGILGMGIVFALSWLYFRFIRFRA